MTSTDPVICRLLDCDNTRHYCQPHPAEPSTTTDADAVLSALAHLQAQREQSRTRLRHLLAYGREFTSPRPYTLASLAHAADMSISGVRTGYDHDNINAVANLLNRAATRRRP